jgi:hypothetical protein
VHFETQSPLLTVKASVEGQELRLIVDSGTSGLVIFHNRFKENAAALRSAQGTFIATVAGTPQAKFFRALVTLGQDTGERIVTITDANLGAADGFDGLLGFTGMGFRRVSFDFDSGTLGWDLDASEPSHGHSSRVPVPWLGCGSGFKGDDCQVALGIVAQALHQLNPRLPGWRVVVVPVDQWRKMSAAFVAHNSVPAFSNLSMASTYLSAELIFSDRDTDMKFLALTRLTGIERLQWVLAHEYGHIICQTHEERKANHAGDYLLRGQIGTCN